MITPEYQDLIGKPFRYGGRGPDYFDCYGLVREMFGRAGKETPDYLSPEKGPEIIITMLSGIQLWKPVEPAPGRMIMINLPHTMHVAYLLEHGRMIHVWDRSGGVCVERAAEWKRRTIGCYEYE